MINFDEYIQQGEPQKREKGYAWQTAIGLQAVDGLKPSKYLIDTARKHIEGDITIDEVQQLIKSYYDSKDIRTEKDNETEEADKVSANITKLLNERSFAFTVAGLTAIHRRILMVYSNLLDKSEITILLKKNGCFVVIPYSMYLLQTFGEPSNMTLNKKRRLIIRGWTFIK